MTSKAEFPAGKRGFNAWIEEVTKMKARFFSRPEQDVEVFETEVAEYCGLTVKVLCRMEHCNLVCYGDREFIVNTEDLCFQRSMRCAA